MTTDLTLTQARKMSISRPRKKVKAKRSIATRRAAPATIPTTFTPQFWQDTDKRQLRMKRIIERVKRLKAEAGADSYQKVLLCERAVFLATRLETLEIEAMQGQEFKEGSYTQMVNALSGLLSKLGLGKTATTDPWFASQDEDEDD